MNEDNKNRKAGFIRGFVNGLGWSLGATFGFAILLTILGFVVRLLGGLPFVGGFFANLVEATMRAMQSKGVFN